jgi:uncharacterized protein (DUF2461 family)
VDNFAKERIESPAELKRITSNYIDEHYTYSDEVKRSKIRYNRNNRNNRDKQPFLSQFRHTMPPDVSDLPQIGG